MNILESNNPCTGCGACAAICIKKAITMELNDNGNLAPIVNDNCVGCGLCRKVCAKYGIENTNDIRIGQLYAAISKDDKFALTCTSSGIATKIAEYGVSNGFYVVGVQYNYDKNIAETIIINTIKDVDKLKKSKYLQAYTMPAYDQIIKIATSENTAKFIIFGMPCQINGIASVVEKLNIKNQFIYIDFFCHGVPSYLTWNKYIQERKKKYKFDKIKEVCFRDKKEGWHNFMISVNGKSHHAVYDSFYEAFFDNILLNEACFDCKARAGYTKADMRLGDFWGKKYKSNNIGVSSCLVITEVGKKILSSISDDFEINKVGDINACLSFQSLNRYCNINVHNNTMNKLKKNISLKKVVSSYQRVFNIKYRVKKIVKKMIYRFPRKLRDKIKEKM